MARVDGGERVIRFREGLVPDRRVVKTLHHERELQQCVLRNPRQTVID
jgi:hypothetical protein